MPLLRRSLLSDWKQRRARRVKQARETSDSDTNSTKRKLFAAPCQRTKMDHAALCKLMRVHKKQKSESHRSALREEAICNNAADLFQATAVKRKDLLCIPARSVVVHPPTKTKPGSRLAKFKLESSDATAAAAAVPPAEHLVRAPETPRGNAALVVAADASTRASGLPKRRQRHLQDLLPTAQLRVAWPCGPRASLKVTAKFSKMGASTVRYVRLGVAHAFLERQKMQVERALQCFGSRFL